MNSARITYAPRLDSEPQAEVDALAAVYRFIFDCHTKKHPAAGPSERGNYDGTTKEASADVSIVPD